MGATIYPLYLMCVDLFETFYYFKLTLCFLLKIFIILLIVAVYMYFMTVTYSTFYGHVTNVWIHGM
jgi:hypothetical protein